MFVRPTELAGRLFLLTLMLFVCLSVSAQTRYPQGLEKVGEARLSLLWLDIYDARLFSADGRYSAGDAPLLLELVYHRSISSEELVEETAKQLEGRLEVSRSEIGRLERLLPSVDSGDSLAFYLTAEGKGVFFFNQRYLGEMEDPAFNRAFIDIWLARDSEFPELTRRLTGGG